MGVFRKSRKNDLSVVNGIKQLSSMSLVEYLLTLALMIAVLLVVVIYIFNSFYKVMMNQTYNDSVVNVGIVADRVENVLQKAVAAVNVSGYTLEKLGTPDRRTLENFIVTQNEIYNTRIDHSFRSIYISYDSIFVSGGGFVPPEGFDIKGRAWHSEAIVHQGQHVVIPPYIDADTKEYIISVSKSFDDGKGVVAIDVTLDAFQRFVQNVTQTGLKNAFVFSRDGFVVASRDTTLKKQNYLESKTDNGEVTALIRQIIRNEKVQKDSAERSRSLELEIDGHKRVAFYEPVDDEFYVVFLVSEAELYDSVQNILILSIILSLFVAIVAGVFITTSYINGAVASRSAREQLKMKKELQKNFDIISLMASYFDSVFYVDCKTLNMITYSAGETIRKFLGDKTDASVSYGRAIQTFVRKIVHSEDRDRISQMVSFDAVEESLKNKKSFSFQCRCLAGKDYRYYRIFFVRSGTDDAYDSFVIAIADEDEIVRRIQDYQSKLELEKQRAEDASAAKSTFLANMSHEIRTPINAVMGMNEMILRECNDTQVRSYAEDIRGASQMLLSIINDILDFSKIEAGKMEIVDVKYDISSVLNDVSTMIGVKAEQKGLKLNVSVDERIPSTLLGDSIRIQQIMLNLLNNSVKYTKVGTVSFSIEVASVVNESVVLKIEVSDTGIGIREEDLAKLFKSFQRLDLGQNRKVEGTGLGLAITGKLIERMNGSVNVKSTYGVGSTFTVMLPQKIVDATPVGNFEKHYQEFKKKQNVQKQSFTAPDAKILVVDDNNMNLRVAKNLMKHLQLQVTTCCSGMECLELLKKNVYDVIFLDHMMPGMDGIETLRVSKSMQDNLCSQKPVIALTANAIVGARETYLQAGFDDYLCKPIKVEELEKCLLKYLPATLVHRGESAEPAASPATAVAPEKTAELDAINPADVAIDTNEGLKYCVGNKSLYGKALKIYVDAYDEYMGRLTSAFDKNDWAECQMVLHTIESNSMSIGAVAFANYLKTLEPFAKSKDANVLFQNLKNRYKRVCDEASGVHLA